MLGREYDPIRRENYTLRFCLGVFVIATVVLVGTLFLLYERGVHCNTATLLIIFYSNPGLVAAIAHAGQADDTQNKPVVVTLSADAQTQTDDAEMSVSGAHCALQTPFGVRVLFPFRSFLFRFVCLLIFCFQTGIVWFYSFLAGQQQSKYRHRHEQCKH